MSPLHTRRRRLTAVAVALPLLAGGTALAGQATAESPVHTITSEVHDSVGTLFTATNHLVDIPGVVPVGEEGHVGKEYIVVWAGDENVADTSGQDIADTPLAVGAVKELSELPTDLPGQDFLAVIDADADSATYGQVVNTVTLGPLPENEPHHMQYIHTAGDSIYAGGLFSDITYVFDTDKLPLLELSGVSNPVDTPCGSVPDAYWVLEDGTAYGTYMGGPDVPGPCQYTNGEIRVGNGFAGSPGSVVRLDREGRTLAEVPAALPTAEFPEDCHNLPVLPTATCANPHGIQVREDLDTMVTSDYCEPRNIILDPVKAPDHKLCRPTVRTWDITDRNNPVVRNVTKLPDGPRRETNPAHEENQAIMETTVTNLPENKGAFAESMCGGAIFYAPDITAPEPAWREVFDNTTAALSVDPDVIEGGGCDGGGWVQTSLDDKYLYHAVIGRGPGAQFPEDQGTTKMIYTLDIQALVAAGDSVECTIDTILEVAEGGEEADCPALVDVLEVTDTTSGGPHWGALDNYVANGDGTYSETTDVDRIAYSNYFVARTGIDGNHRVCIADVEDGVMTVDEDFRDEARGGTCVDFNRLRWPHGETGNAKPHSMIFAVAGGDVR
ncbi:hypothetical protein GCM10017691_44090 [Pseudonocardia petroleophila]|uniref:selenium-binding family protein n=1 Tax=Pseudonocardia petroleophila TaxID=37331 RepID=UPI002104D7D7|nr:selenium-binding family protein [Pseudonocardia petroleophila]